MPDTNPTPTRAHVSQQRQRVFLAHLSRVGRIRRAAALSEVDTSSLYKERKANPDFAARWQEALDRAVDWAEDELYRRGVEGWEEPVYQGGRLIGYVTRYSDADLALLLKSARPAKYREGYKADGADDDVDLARWPTQDGQDWRVSHPSRQ